jgi:protoheme IX farnesyltransferase
MSARSESPVRSVVQERSSVYYELTKPRISFMVLLTVGIGFALAPGVAGGWTLLHVLLGAFLSCSGAGALNQYIERDTDSVMARTRFRPLPQHRVSDHHVLALGAFLSLGGVAYLMATTNALTALVDALTLASYLLVYTPMKRVTSISTLIGAVPGALPPVMGWTAATGEIGPGAVILFAILFLWQIPHFLAIGRMYRDDYEGGGFPMLVVVDPNGQATGRQMFLYALALIPVAMMPSVIGLAGTLYGWAALAAGLVYLLESIRAARKPESREAARRLLLVSVTYLPVLFAALFGDLLLRAMLGGAGG